MLARRLVTALLFGGFVAVGVLALPTAAAALGLLWLAGAWEWAGLARWDAAARSAYAALFAGLMLSAPYWLFGIGAFDAVLGLAAVWWALALAAVLSIPRSIPLPLVAAAGVPALLPSWLVLTYLHARAPQGPGLVFAVWAVVWAADVGAYACGRRFGRIKLAPQVSPGKTWEGVLGGAALAAATAWLASLLLALPGTVFVSIAVAAALVSVVGDLAVSLLKRNVGLKDSGRLLPGHGGIMDRIDSLAAAVPVFAIGLKLAGWI